MRHFPEVRRVRSPLAGAALALACVLAPGVPAPPATAQTVDTDSLREARRQQVEAYAARVDRAAGVFLDADRPDGERLEAVEGIAVFNRPEHLRSAAEIVLDSAEEVAIRARALRLAGHAADSDTAFLRGMFALALDGGTAPRLRRGMSELFQSLMFASASKLLLRQRFAGALQGQRASKGVFITTSSFSSEAEEYAEQIDSRLILIDGQKLTQLMVDHDIGVSATGVYEVKKVDTDYFTEL